MSDRPNIAARICIIAVRGYQVTLGPLMGGHCRFHPTCSHYAVEAFRAHGMFRGMWLTSRRLLKCHPLSRRAGFDPVPDAPPNARATSEATRNERCSSEAGVSGD